MNPVSINLLHALERQGQAVWLDFLSRGFLEDGGLTRLVAEDGLSGVTSNPSIFEKAIGETEQYDADVAGADEGASVTQIYEALAIKDIRHAADVLRPVYERTDGADGFTSLEVSPYLANDTQGSIAEAKRLWEAVDRENLMIKIPATPAGLPAIRHLIGAGINVNITLLFSQQVYEQVAEAYLGGLERLAIEGRNLSRVASVASFFVSRIDTAVDKLLDRAAANTRDETTRRRLEALRGKVAVANAKLAYRRFRQLFSEPRWERLAAKGARVQRVLWASTGTKNPAYSDTLYVDTLIGPDTINTMPTKTIEAFRDHGHPRPTIEEDIGDAERVLAELSDAGISLNEVTADLVTDGVRLFADSFDKLLVAVARKRAKALGPRLNSQKLALADAWQKDADAAAEEWRKAGNMRRLWRKDAGLWTGHDEAQWLGWLDVTDAMLAETDVLAWFADDIRQSGVRDVVLLGMGGSSLGPEVLGKTFGSRDGFPKLHVLDSTDPQQVAAVEAKIDLAHTLFIVSSKSGTTLEPNVLKDYFLDRVAAVKGKDATSAFLAITDPGSALQSAAKAFRGTLLGVPSVGGRYSVLSNFGMVPAAAIGLDVAAFLRATRMMVRACGGDVPPADNPGAALGLAMGVLAKSGRDKVTIVASPGIADFGAWAEQLIAESTGKNGKGLIPVDGEPLGPPEAYGSDRFFIQLRLDGDASEDEALAHIAKAGHPVARIDIADKMQLGQEFFRWEMAIAVAGAVIEVNPFDQPDVEASKVATRDLTAAAEKKGRLPRENPVAKGDGLALFTDKNNADALRLAGAERSPESWLRAHFSRAKPGDYAALLAYIERNHADAEVLQEIRTILRDRLHIATCVGFGPRFLHSTGQAYKGGPDTGLFLQITADDAQDLAIPGRKATFGLVKAAQARGDFQVLAERGRRALRVHLGGDVGAGLAKLATLIRKAVS
jgi:transaldolase/glucose-6-phosphate isomerase